MTDKKIAHRVYFDEKYNKPYVRVYWTVNGKTRFYEKLDYKIPNKRDYKYIDGRTSAVEMSCSKFKEFRKLNNISISECEYFKSTSDDSFYYNEDKRKFFVKLNKGLYESFSPEDTIYKYSFGTKNRKLQIKVDKIDFTSLAEQYERVIQDKLDKKQRNLRRKINKAISRDFGKFDNLFPSYFDKWVNKASKK